MYRISNRQRKELSNGKVLCIAIPHPPGDEITDPAGWAREWLDCQPGRIVSAEVAMVPVNPSGRKGSGLQEILGEIVLSGLADMTPPILNVECVVVRVAARREPRGNYPMQWPASYG